MAVSAVCQRLGDSACDGVSVRVLGGPMQARHCAVCGLHVGPWVGGEVHQPSSISDPENTLV